jgi:UDP-N-acetyl-2-amino-2-deoxyglucuronate dehydrogenase
MTGDAIRIGIIGTSNIARRLHAPDIANTPGLTLCAACDSNPDTLAQFSDDMGITRRFLDYRDLLAGEDIDAVGVIAPHDLHEEICGQALQRGKHVLVEKPIARNVQEADRIIQAADQTDRVFMVGFNQRYTPIHQEVRRLLSAGALGHVRSARIDHHQDFRKPEASWWRSKEAVGGGCVIGSGIHRLDLLRWFLGEPAEVFAYHLNDPDRLEAEVIVTASIRFESGAIANFFCNWAVPCANGTTSRRFLGECVTLFGTTGTVHVNREEAYIIDNDRRPVETAMQPMNADPKEHESMWAHFERCIRTGVKPLTNGLDARNTLSFVEALNRSMSSGKPEKVRDVS